MEASDAVLLCVAVEADLARHRGPGLVDWRRVPAARRFVVARERGLEETLAALAPRLGEVLQEPPRPLAPRDWCLRRLHPSWAHCQLPFLQGAALELQPAAGHWSCGYDAQDVGGFHVNIVLLDRRQDDRGVIVKLFSDGDLRFWKRISSVDMRRMAESDNVFVEEIGFPPFFETNTDLQDSIELSDPPVFGGTYVKIANDVSNVDDDNDNDFVDSVVDAFRCFRARRIAHRCVRILVERRASERGDFGLLPVEILKMIEHFLAQSLQPKFRDLRTCSTWYEIKTAYLFGVEELSFDPDAVLQVLLKSAYRRTKEEWIMHVLQVGSGRMAYWHKFYANLIYQSHVQLAMPAVLQNANVQSAVRGTLKQAQQALRKLIIGESKKEESMNEY